MFNKLRLNSGLLRPAIQYVQAKRTLRGKAPEKARTLQQRLEGKI